jgi:autotransporter passenger strand-loop-strand repeat protein
MTGVVVSSGTTYSVTGVTDTGDEIFGTEVVLDGGVTISATIQTYDGEMYVDAGGVASDTFNAGGIIISSGGVAREVLNAYGSLDVLSGGISSDVTNTGYLNDQGIQMLVYSGGIASTTVLTGGTLYVASGGAAYGVTLSSGTELGVYSSGSVVSGLVMSAGAKIDIDPSKVLSAMVNGSDQLVAVSGGTVVATFGLTSNGLGDVDIIATPDNTSGTFLIANHLKNSFEDHGVADFVIENTSGDVDLGEVGSSGTATYTLVGGLGSNWIFGGSGAFSQAGDYLGDGQDQFLIESTTGSNTGEVYLGQVSGSSTTYVHVANLGLEWSFHGAGDFLGAGEGESQDQFLMENTAGAVDVGTVSGTTSSATTTYTSISLPTGAWTIEGAGNLFGDGQAQFIVENTSGTVEIGEVHSGTAAYTSQVVSLGPEWKFVGTGDFLGDGKDQFLIESTSGTVDVGEVNSAHSGVMFTTVGSLGPEWTFVGAGDYYGIGRSSFLIENTAGAVDTGTVVSGTAQYAAVAALGPEWSFRA